MLPPSLLLLLSFALVAVGGSEQIPLRPPIIKHPWVQRFSSIGDSYSAGLGAGPRLDYYCSRYTHSHPHILHTSLLGPNPNRTHQFLSCSGQTSTEILNTQVPALTPDIDLLTISAGGNDIGLNAILNACIYQFSPTPPQACETALEAAHKLITSPTELKQNITRLVDAVKPKMHPIHGTIYITGYASFFGTASHACDNVTWSVWPQSALDYEASTQPFLRLELRRKLNDLVTATNAVLRGVVEKAGPRVHFVDYDAEITKGRGRFCEDAVVEPAPNRVGLSFYEWDTVDVDSGESATDVLKCSGGEVRRTSFEGSIAEEVAATVEEHPSWGFRPGMGGGERCVVVAGAERGEVSGDGIVEDTIHWLLPDSWKRIFHLRPNGQEIIARLIATDLDGREVEKDEVDEL